MFAGYTCGDTFTREMIQIEPSTPEFTSGNHDPAPLRLAEGEFIYPENITIEDCHFGKNDEAGAPPEQQSIFRLNKKQPTRSNYRVGFCISAINMRRPATSLLLQP